MSHDSPARWWARIRASQGAPLAAAPSARAASEGPPAPRLRVRPFWTPRPVEWVDGAERPLHLPGVRVTWDGLGPVRLGLSVAGRVPVATQTLQLVPVLALSGPTPGGHQWGLDVQSQAPDGLTPGAATWRVGVSHTRVVTPRWTLQLRGDRWLAGAGGSAQRVGGALLWDAWREVRLGVAADHRVGGTPAGERAVSWRPVVQLRW